MRLIREETAQCCLEVGVVRVPRLLAQQLTAGQTGIVGAGLADQYGS